MLGFHAKNKKGKQCSSKDIPYCCKVAHKKKSLSWHMGTRVGKNKLFCVGKSMP